ncbi:hypothetical protein FACS189449_01990 [Alphaproteobacteria bacterium]|nr:hypothetical protein FACS189449_01990 [Alphaproteobacteria bacterium]
MNVKYIAFAVGLCSIFDVTAMQVTDDAGDMKKNDIQMVELSSSAATGQKPTVGSSSSDENKTYSNVNEQKAAQLRELLLNHRVARIASFDGGGIRGVIPAVLMTVMEEKLGIPIAQAFHMEIGTSTGGLLTALLTMPSESAPSVPRYPAKQILEMYLTRGTDIFKEMSFISKLLRGFRDKYSSENFDRVSNELFGDTTLDKLVGDVVLTYYNMSMKSPAFFKSSFARDAVAFQSLPAGSSSSSQPTVGSPGLPSRKSTATLGNPPSSASPADFSSSPSIDSKKRNNFYVRDCAISTSSAPSYFAPYKLRTLKQTAEASKEFTIALDGGICVNNPYLCGVTEAAKLYPNADAFLVVSFGTGECEDITVKKAPSTILGWAKDLPDMFMGGESKMAFHILKTLGTLYNKEIYFARLQMKLPKEHIAMDNTSQSNVQYLVESAREFANAEGSIMDILCSALRGTEKTLRSELATMPEHQRHSNFIQLEGT